MESHRDEKLSTSSQGAFDVRRPSASATEDTTGEKEISLRRQSIDTGPNKYRHSRRDEIDDIQEEDDTALGRIASTAPTQTRPRSRSNVPPPPDGGLQAWIQVLSGWLVIFATWGYLNSFGAFQSYYNTTLTGTSASSISWIGSFQGFLTTGIGAFTGRLLDAGLFRPTFAIGAILQLVGIFTMSVSTKYWHLLLTQGIITGIGGGIIFTPTIALVATWFSGRRGLAIGLVTTGNSTGGIIYPLIVRQLIPKLGFGWTARVLGLVNLICLGVAFLLMKSRLPPRRSGPLIEWSAFTEVVYVAYVCGLFLFVWANYYFFYYVAMLPSPYMLTSLPVASYGIQELGLSYNSASILVMIVNGCGLPARIFVPMLADRAGALNIMTVVTLCMAVVLFFWFAVSSATGFYIFTAVCGLVSGGVQSLMPTTVASITKRLDTVGTRLGMAFSVISFASLTGPPIGGALQAASGNFDAPRAWAAASTLVGGLLYIVARVSRVGWSPKAKC